MKKLSVCMITYNHEKYIREAILGVLNQETNFEFELVISNDNSTDKTDSIIKKIIKEHPKGYLINYINQKVNLGMMPNFAATLHMCKLKYLALCEGDDYWTDSLKLQKQVDFLEANNDYAICFHEVLVFNQELSKLQKDTITRDVEITTSINELSEGNFIHTPSAVIRNNFNLPLWFLESPIGDYPLYCIAVKNHKIFKFTNVMAVYRVHNMGIMNQYRKETYINNIEHKFSYIILYYNLWRLTQVKNFKSITMSTFKSYRSYTILKNKFYIARVISFKMITKYYKALNCKEKLITFTTIFSPSIVKKYFKIY